MAAPRRIVAGTTYLITRRCSHRTFRLRPSEATNQSLAYCLALALEKTGVVLHAVCVMSNHHHMVVTDPHGVLPNFLRELHRATAKTMNAAQGQWENFWAAAPCSVVELGDAQDVLEKIAYVAANPVAAGLVAVPEEWPGLSLWTECAIRVKRVTAYFGERSKAPRELILRVVRPYADAMRTQCTDWRGALRRAIDERIREAHRALRERGRKFLGRAAIMNEESFVRSASSYEAKRTTVPSIAARDPATRTRLRQLRNSFRRRYREALGAWTAGARNVVFPFGTWWMCVHHAALCGSASDFN